MKKEDLTGRRYGRLLVLSRKINSKPILWDCLCDCGNIIAVTRGNLNDNKKKSCGCILIERKDKPENFINKKFGLWSVIEFYGRTKNGNHWLCQCECGTIRAVHATQLKKNYSKDCGCIGKEIRRLKSTKPESPLNTLYSRYSRKAKQKQIGFYINKTDFLKIIKSDCYYCGNKPTQISKSNALYNVDLLYNSVARIDSNKEYTTENCVARCYQCNFIKTPKKDITGEKFGLLTAISLSHREEKQNKKGKFFWNFLCECGNTIVADKKLIIHGTKQHCGCQNISDEEAALIRYYKSYIIRAKDKKLNFEISLEEFKKNINKNCYYCSKEPTRQLWVFKNSLCKSKFNGIDRVDNNIGYIPSNIVTCCKHCNIAKRVLPVQEFLNHIELIYSNFIDSHIWSEECVIPEIPYTGMYSQLKKRCLKYGKECLITEDFFKKIIRQKCFYCKSIPYQKHHKSIYGGIDRIDSSIGYLESNCVPCCKNCNYIKYTDTIEKFKDTVTRIHNASIKRES